ncbi:GntR family transcriptional regulator [Actinomadura syzygii]|uniref:GntR family transcriptional regulator n=1 Tax=Actinomadura syzygii TaxID=1427538 RepID=UPI001651EC1E|nr:GntR family transcriptional regulator [Actinomadura syzygii]
MGEQTGKSTRVHDVYARVRQDLLAAHYRPGQWLRLAPFQQEFQVSLSVVREAFSRLAAEGLLESVALRGFRVRELSGDDLQDLTDARIHIEVLVLRESLASGGTQWEADLLAAHHVLERTPIRAPSGRGVNREFIPVHAAFHHALLAGCRNARLLMIARELRDNAELYRMWSPVVDQSGRDIAWEHRELTRLALERDVEACADLLARHIDHTRQALLGGRATAGDGEVSAERS